MATVSSRLVDCKVSLFKGKKGPRIITFNLKVLRIPGGLKHISVGSKSVFGVNCDDNIYTMTDISFNAKGHFQIDASKRNHHI